MSPTQRTLKMVRDSGFTAQVVEHWNAFAKIRVDLFRVIDIVAMAEGVTVGLQATSATNHSARRNKIISEPLALLWVLAGNHLWLVSWGKKKNRWEPRIDVIGEQDFNLTNSEANHDQEERWKERRQKGIERLEGMLRKDA